jgi:hypothetical protein
MWGCLPFNAPQTDYYILDSVAVTPAGGTARLSGNVGVASKASVKSAGPHFRGWLMGSIWSFRNICRLSTASETLSNDAALDASKYLKIFARLHQCFSVCSEKDTPNHVSADVCPMGEYCFTPTRHVMS